MSVHFETQTRAAATGKAATRDTLLIAVCVIVSLILVAISLRYAVNLWLLSFVYSFQTHFGLACMLAMAFCCLWKRNPYMFALLAISALLTVHSLIMQREFSGNPPADDDRPVYRLLSFNILTDNHANAGRIAEFVETSGADVVYILEARPLRQFLPSLMKSYPYRLGCGEATDTCDLLVLSRHPIRSPQFASLSELREDRFARSSIELDGVPVQFAAAHLTKPYYDDYHSEELRVLSQTLSDVDEPLILAGDFNSASIAPDMQRFLRHNAFHTDPSFEPATWPVKAGPFGIAIDHVYARAPIQLKSVTRLPQAMGSNHYGLMAEFVIEAP